MNHSHSSPIPQPAKPQRQILVSIKDQQLTLFDAATHPSLPIAKYPISSAKNGIGFEPESFKTPTGRFLICEKIGNKASPLTIFKGRQPVGLHSPGNPNDEDLILARILRLDGLDTANANTKSRFIYIHGTNHLSTLGTPSSQGCIRMSPDDIIDLFAQTPMQTPVTITP